MRRGSGFCNLLLQQFSFLYIQTLRNHCSYIEVVHLFILYTFHYFLFHFWGLKLRHFFCKMCRGCLTCVICKSKIFHSLIFQLCIMISHRLNMCNSYFVHIWLIFSYCLGLLNLDILSIWNAKGVSCFFKSVTPAVFIPSYSNLIR